MKKLNFIRALSASALVFAAAADAATLNIGDAAPALQVGKWVQGEPVSGFDSNHVYIVEFWATWCGPCRTSIPHLNEKWEKFKGKNLVVIGQDCWENDESLVPDFVKKMGDKMTYDVALDDKRKETKGAMVVNWMEAADQHGIPTAFVVNRHGQIAWIGHPMSLEDSVLEQVLADTFDMAAAAKEFAQAQASMAERSALSGKLNTAMQAKDWDAAESALNEIEKAMPESRRFGYGPTRLKILLGRKDFAGAEKLAESLSDAHTDNAGFQNDLAWTLVTDLGLDKPGLALAEKIAERANAAAKGGDAPILDTLAHAQFRNGKTDAALATEAKAAALVTGVEKGFYDKIVQSFQSGKLPDMKE